jgi:spermidine synthase
MRHALLFSVFVIASCGLAYELIAGALSSYLLGDSVTQFSTVIGTYLFAMGAGSWLSKYITRDLIGRFIQIELMVGLLGGFSAVGLFLVFTWLAGPFKLVLYLPGVRRRRAGRAGNPAGHAHPEARTGLQGSRVASAHFRLSRRAGRCPSCFRWCWRRIWAWCAPGCCSACSMWRWRCGRCTCSATNCPARRWLAVQSWSGLRPARAGFAGAGHLTTFAEAHLYADDIVHAETTPYQRIVVTRWRDDLRLFLNNNLQFSSHDEYRYHEALVHPGLASLPGAKRVLVLGGGDGLAVREILKYPKVESVTLVDLDPAMTELFATAPALVALNEGALKSERVKVVNADALQWLEESRSISTSSSSTFPIRPTSRSASCTPRPSTGCSKSACRRTACSSSSRPRRSTPGNPSGAW